MMSLTKGEDDLVRPLCLNLNSITITLLPMRCLWIIWRPRSWISPQIKSSDFHCLREDVARKSDKHSRSVTDNLAQRLRLISFRLKISASSMDLHILSSPISLKHQYRQRHFKSMTWSLQKMLFSTDRNFLKGDCCSFVSVI